jgi:transposase InsO family protein
MTVYRILCQTGLNHPLEKPRTKRTYERWQRRHSNSLWQCDLKIVDRWLITILDDHSRFVTASQIFKKGSTENVIWLLNKAIHEYTKPREILTEYGSQFWSVRRGESNLDAYCQQQKISHILGGIGKSTTLGKIERWFRTYDLEHARFQMSWYSTRSISTAQIKYSCSDARRTNGELLRPPLRKTLNAEC